MRKTVVALAAALAAVIASAYAVGAFSQSSSTDTAPQLTLVASSETVDMACLWFPYH